MEHNSYPELTFFIKKLIFDRALLSSKRKKEPHRYHFTTLTLPIHYHITIYRVDNGRLMGGQ